MMRVVRTATAERDVVANIIPSHSKEVVTGKICVQWLGRLSIPFFGCVGSASVLSVAETCEDFGFNFAALTSIASNRSSVSQCGHLKVFLQPLEDGNILARKFFAALPSRGWV